MEPEVDTNLRVREKKINVPMQYRNGAKFLKAFLEDGKSLSNAIENNHCKISSMYSLLSKIRANKPILDQIVEKTQIFEKEPRLNPWMGRFLIGELLFGRGQLSGNSKPVECVLSYEEKLREALEHADGEISTEKFEYKVPRYIRINTLKIKRSEAHEYLQNEGWYLVPKEADETYDVFLEKIRTLQDDQYLIDYHVDDILIFPSSSRRVWAHNELVRDWQLILQDKASCLPPFLLNPPKGAHVLDMCAAPGMKTTYLAAVMKNKGKLYAVERDVRRYKELCTIVDMSDARIVQPINEDVFKIDNERCPDIEYILLDPSCSGSGMLSRDGKEQFDKDRVYKLAGLQYKLLKHAMFAFPSVKRIVYSTCSRYTEENEDIVHGIIKTTENFKLLNASELFDGKQWSSKGSELYGEIGPRCLYARTKDDMTCTFFLAVFERCGEGETNEFYQSKRWTGPQQQQGTTEDGQDRNAFTGKLRKQAKFSNSNVTDKENFVAEVKEEVDTPKKRKKSKTVDDEPAVYDEQPPESSKKSKKNKKEPLSDDNPIEEETSHVEDVVVKKEKRKKTKTVDAEPTICEEQPVESSKKSKKSKKKHTSDDNPDEEVSNVEDVVIEKKKKSKKRSAEPEPEVEDPTPEDLAPKKVKKSKKKKEKQDC